MNFSFLLEMVIAKDPSYVLSHSSLSFNFMFYNIGTHNETMKSCLLLSFFFICTNADENAQEG